jgi:hypothetical protein
MIEVDVVLPESGYPDRLAAEDTRANMMAAAGDKARDFPQELWIEPKHWEEKAKENDANGTWGLNYLDRFTHQGNSHECTCHSLRAGFEAARNRQRGVIYGGPKAGTRNEDSAKYGSVWVAPLSIYAEANPQKWGGANCRQVLEIACKRGFLPDVVQPFDYGFKHAIHGTAGGQDDPNQGSGPWVAVSRFPAGWKETAAGLIVEEAIFPEDYEQAICLLLHSMIVNVGREGHAVPWARWDWQTRNCEYPDSYNVIRADSPSRAKRAVGGASAIATVRAPDDWMKPAA